MNKVQKIIVIILVSLFTIRLDAQTILHFDKSFLECEDKWVALPEKDSAYIYGFIYLDEQAGLTFNYEGSFKIMPTGEFIPKKLGRAGSIKVRLQPSNVLVAFIPENKFQELKIKAVPDWLKFYKTDTNSVVRLYRWGFIYNGWNECAEALTYLQKAQKIDPNYKGLSVELAFSYNCLGEYDSAVSVLKDAIKANPMDAYTNKELIYAQTKSGQLDEASENCRNAIAMLKDRTYNGEMCYNLLASYFFIKDKTNFNLWLNETKKWNANNEKLLRNITVMENAINNKYGS